jgi:hypothetical protein
MKFGLKRSGLFVLGLIAVGVLAGCGGSGPAQSVDGGRGQLVPVAVALSPSVANAGTTVSFSVDLDAIAGTPTSVSIGCSDSSMFTNLPSSVIVPAGTKTVTFSSTLSSNANGYYSVTATRGANVATATGRAIWGN